MVGDSRQSFHFDTRLMFSRPPAKLQNPRHPLSLSRTVTPWKTTAGFMRQQENGGARHTLTSDQSSFGTEATANSEHQRHASRDQAPRSLGSYSWCFARTLALLPSQHQIVMLEPVQARATPSVHGRVAIELIPKQSKVADECAARPRVDVAMPTCVRGPRE